MSAPRTARADRALIAADRDARHVWTDNPGPAVVPTFTLDRRIAEARRLMGEARWAELQAEWGA